MKVEDGDGRGRGRWLICMAWLVLGMGVGICGGRGNVCYMRNCVGVRMGGFSHRGGLLGVCELKMHSFSRDWEIGRRYKLSSCPFVHSSDR